ncbi:blue copper protein-like [Cynara cardunculus var. scolymus]|uniref:Cupredoxin n=1 Tax=Cynara cardunculus var. scolymus TaxID=59895 RepID=A0A103YD10_CYNCS|nr:blue copper protein-like [Cynara cardunculus var. scolymus]KVI06831.1 Cupredoxin [Cynara cardunculus var. scolymus]
MTINGVGFVLLIVLLSCGMPCLAKVYTVGDSSGWSLGVDYKTWTSGKTFQVGDTLSFNYGSTHSVDEVSSGDYGTCTAGNAIASYTSGPTTIALNTTGTHYFICGVAGHCSGGMKVSVPVTAASSAPSGTAKPTPTPSTSTTTPASSAAFSPAVPLVCSLVLFIFNLVVS